SPVHKNVWLGGQKPESHALDLTWTNYFGWPDGVNSYEVYRKNDADRILLFSRNTGLDTLYNYDDGMKNYVQRYRIAALPNGGNDTSWSNEIEVVYSAVLWIPNAFTPNDDGLNRVFNMVSGSIKHFNITIYNRWGERMYTSTDVNGTWDGRFKGVPVPEGVYIYHVDYMGGDNVMKHDKGSITIIR
ncbi:MAG TPA: gliding motility-associated C-terminal domain-containing protein, partial [Bacteroidia bacterium]|nr:gliding motility-associated C-terminal domain-containing protein [Bacteroidia bacterium]